MKKITCVENYIKKTEEVNHYSCFLIEPIDVGQGITLGNALRRTLLLELSGYAISGVRINNLKHEFENSNEIREDTLEILLNLKEVIIRGPIGLTHRKLKSKISIRLSINGPAVITSGLLNAALKKRSTFLEIIDPSIYICTVTNKSKFHLELDIEKNKGYKAAENSKFNSLKNFYLSIKPHTLAINSVYSPIKQVNFNIKKISDAKGNIKESLRLSILTNSSISPLRCLREALKILLELFFPYFLDPIFLKLYIEFSLKKFIHCKHMLLISN